MSDFVGKVIFGLIALVLAGLLWVLGSGLNELRKTKDMIPDIKPNPDWIPDIDVDWWPDERTCRENGYGGGPSMKQKAPPVAMVRTPQAYEFRWYGTDAQAHDNLLVVLKACEARLSYIQTTPFGSDEAARALFELAKTIDTLAGTQEVSAPIPDMGATNDDR